MAKIQKTQPSILAQNLTVVLETYHEQRKLISMSTQGTSQEKLVKPLESCYYCRGHNRPCLWNISAKKTPIYKHDFRESSRSSLTLPPVATLNSLSDIFQINMGGKISKPSIDSGPSIESLFTTKILGNLEFAGIGLKSITGIQRFPWTEIR